MTLNLGVSVVEEQDAKDLILLARPLRLRERLTGRNADIHRC